MFIQALLIVLPLGMAVTWLWQTGYTVNQAVLKIQSAFKGIQVSPQMVKIEGGSFQQGHEKMGGLWGNPVHEVTVKPFAIGKYEVTFEEYDRFAISTGRRLPEDMVWGREHRPVINVSWNDAKDYAKWLSDKSGENYRLPTEAEWEYAGRSGAKQDTWAGTSKESELADYAVFANNSKSRTAEVGIKQANRFGLHDLSGNVWEWVEDCWHDTYTDAPKDGSAWQEKNTGDCSRHPIRGGSWLSDPDFLSTTFRNRGSSDGRVNDIGFRLAQDIEP